MKNIVLLLMLILVSTTFSQDMLESISEDVLVEIQGSAPTKVQNTYGIIQGGKEKTATGVLKVLVVIVRFKDDTNEYYDWDDYLLLPDWAEALVDGEVPANGIYQNVNLSNFFNRESGGDGNGVLGSFQMIGDVYYVSTDENKSYYTNDAAVNNHVMHKLDTQFSIDFREYDNWEFRVNNEYYNHRYSQYDPTIGIGCDGKLDHALIFWREPSISYGSGVGGYKSLNVTSFTTSDGTSISSSCGTTQFDIYAKGGPFNTGKRRCITAPAHEYSHFLFGGIGNVGTHWDGEVTHGGNKAANKGMLNRFALMTSSENYSYCALEKYLLGWLEPRVVFSNSLYTAIYDTHVKNDAVMVPIRYDATGRLAEYYFIENFQTTNSYAGANPFKLTNVFEHTFSNGLLIYHIENMDFSINDAGSSSASTYTKSRVDIETADGLWNWGLSQGTSTPSDRTDDKLEKTIPNRNNGLDERDYIQLTVGSTYWDDYMALTPASLGSNSGTNHGRRYPTNDWLGDPDDLFEMGTERVFTPWSNPSTEKYNGGSSNFGFEIKYYLSSQHKYVLQFGFDSSTIQGYIPSKPQNFKATFGYNASPVLTWSPNIEPDLSGYRVYRKLTTQSGTTTTYIFTTNITYTDGDFTANYKFGTDNAEYWVVAIDNTNRISVQTEHKSTDGFGGSQQKRASDAISDIEILSYTLNSNYPNPFNPSTKISYQIPEDGFVNLIVYNMLGQEVAQLVNQTQGMGKYSVKFNASNLPSGVYIYKLQAGEFSSVKKMMLTK